MTDPILGGINSLSQSLNATQKATKNLKKKWDNGEMEHVRKMFSNKLKETRKLGKIKSNITSKKELELVDFIRNCEIGRAHV